MAKKLDAPNYTQIPNSLLGDIAPGNKVVPGLMAQLKEAELKVLLAVCRLTFGFHQTERRASLTMITKMTGLSRQSVISAAKKLERTYEVIERNKDGGVTLWKVTVQNLDHQGVQNLDQGVQNLDQGVQNLDSDLRKKPRKKPEKETIYRDPQKKPDYLDDVLNHKTGQEGVANPADDFETHFSYRDQALKIYHDLSGRWADVRVGKPAIVELSKEEGFDPNRWENSIRSALLAGVRAENIQCFIDTYRAGGDYKLLFKNGNGAKNGQHNHVQPGPGPNSPYSEGDFKRQDDFFEEIRRKPRL